MKKRCIHFFGPAQERENQQIQVDTKNRISNIRRKMSRGAANICRSRRLHSAIGVLKGWGKNYKSNSKLGHHTPSKKFGK